MSEDKSIPINSAALEAFAKGSAAAGSCEGASANEPEKSAHAQESTQDNARFPITVLPGFCTRLAGSACDRCTFVCPYGAILFDEQNRPQIETDFCTRCGLCCGICDAFVTERITMNDLLEKVRRLSAEGEPVFFTCYDQIPEDFEVHPNVIVLPCIGAVAPEFWAAALEAAPQVSIYCNFALCTDCPTAGPEARAFFTHAVNLGEQWTRIHMGNAELLPERADLLTRFFDATEEEYQRRGIATSLINEVEDIASGRHRRRNSDTLNSFHARKEAMRAQGHAKNRHHHYHVPSRANQPLKKTWPRLQLIVNTVEEHSDIAPNIPRYFAAVDEALCEHCYEPCFSHCPAGARAVDETGTIAVDAHLCIACGNCALFCPTGAAYLYETDASIFLSESPEAE